MQNIKNENVPLVDDFRFPELERIGSKITSNP